MWNVMYNNLCNMKLLEYLKSPELVVKIQEFFGVLYLKNLKLSNKIDNNLSINNKRKQSPATITRALKTNRKKELFTDDECSTDSETEFDNEIIITNKFWYYLFLIGTGLGDELFYATFIPFWFWNIDGAVGRRVVFVWSSVMYVGQGFKDIIRWPRPGPPVQRLQKKWALEYGMPSTHAMVAVSIPFSVLIYTMNRYQYSVVYGLCLSIVWCSLICVSRLYLGMHSVLDILAGIVLTILLLIPLIPIVDYLDKFILESLFSPILVLTISILLIYYYPDADRWTPTRGDTALTISVCAGIQIGAWINFQFGDMKAPTTPPPYEILWPSYEMLGFLILRTVLGLCVVLATRAISKSISYGFFCALMGRDKNELKKSENSLKNKPKITVELCNKYFTCSMIGLSTQYLLPNVFKMLGIGRPDFFTEF